MDSSDRCAEYVADDHTIFYNYDKYWLWGRLSSCATLRAGMFRPFVLEPSERVYVIATGS